MQRLRGQARAASKVEVRRVRARTKAPGRGGKSACKRGRYIVLLKPAVAVNDALPVFSLDPP